MSRQKVLLSPAMSRWRRELEALLGVAGVPAWMPASLASIDRVVCSAAPGDIRRAARMAERAKVPLTILGRGPVGALEPDGCPLSFWRLDLEAGTPVPDHPRRASVEGALGTADAVRGKRLLTLWENGHFAADRPDGVPEAIRTNLDPEPSPEAFADAVLVGTALYRDPYGEGTLDPEEALDLFAFLRQRIRENDRRAFCVGVKWWNHKGVAALLAGAAKPAVFTDDFDAALAQAKEENGRLIAWSASATPEREAAARDAGVPFMRMEDGFLRSVGLGAALARGASAAFDATGIYFDATRASDLETLLETRDLTETEIARGRNLKEAVVAARLTKYNVGRPASENVFPEDRTGILVPGQVADDAGILKTLSTTVDCSGATNVNESLLKAVRARNPDAFIVYKPHPDVEADLRKGKVPEDVARRHADAIVRDVDILDLIEGCDRIETVSSLAGFEALMRGKAVTVHGMPFYAGWGLTEDLASTPRRTRKRSIDELVFCAMIAYCRYIDPETMLHCRPERLIGNLSRLRGDRRHHLRYAAIKFISWFGRKIGL